VTHPTWERLNGHVEGEADPSGATAIVAHLASCDQCHEAVARILRLRAAAETLPPVSAPDGAWDAIRARLDNAPQMAVLPRRDARRLGFAIAAGVAVIIGAAAIRRGVQEGPTSASLAPSNAAAHDTYRNAVTELEASYLAVRTQFTPEARAAADAALAAVEAAIRDARSAAAQGDATIAAEMLRHGQAQKLDLLRRYAEMAVTL
jgi:hypothetical protein